MTVYDLKLLNFESESQSFFNIVGFRKICELQIHELQNRELQGLPVSHSNDLVV